MDVGQAQTAIGFFLTMVNLIATFFYVQLSTWYRELLELQQKFELNRFGDDRAERRRECSFQLKRLYNHVPVLVAGLVTVLLIVIAVLSVLLGAQFPRAQGLFVYYAIAGAVALVIYFVLTGYFLINGYRLGGSLQRQIEAAIERDEHPRRV